MTSAYDAATIDLTIIEDPRLLALPRGVRYCHLEAIVWAKARRTDGFIPTGALRRLTDEDEPSSAADQLVEAGLWATHVQGWEIVGFTAMQMDRAHVERRVAKAKDARDRYEARNPDRPRRGKGDRTDTSREQSREGTASLPAFLPAKEEGQVGATRDTGEPSAPVPLRPQNERRRDMGRAIRESTDDLLRKRYRRTFEREYGSLYGRPVPA